MKDVIAKVRGYFFTLKCQLTRKNILIGSGLKLYCKLEIEGPGKVSIGNDCIVSKVGGDNRHYVTIYTRDPAAEVSIGNNARLFAARISSKFEIKIGDDLLMEESGIMDTDFHSLNPDRVEPLENRHQCRVNIGNRVSIGARSVICKGVMIGDDVVVWPGSIVNKSVPSGTAVCGNPARLVKQKTA